MNSHLESLMSELADLEKRISDEFEKKEKELKFKIEKGKIKFERDQIERFRRIKKNIFKFIFEPSILTIMTSPFIYMVIFPCFLMDIFVTCYQYICFPVYNIPKVKRNEYIVLDRHKLKYLNYIERLNCSYCSYFNGTISYVQEVASRTEQYWCPIRHALKVKAKHARTHNFIVYGDANNYHKKVGELREELRHLESLES